MITLTPLQLQKIKEHVLSCYPEEACGVCTQDDFIPVLNVAEDPERAFEFPPETFLQLRESIVAIVHSHTKKPEDREEFDLRTPSRGDWLGQKISGKPWLIVGCEGIEVSNPIQFPREPSNVYAGRQFMWYINDCYTLIMDYYKFELGIELKGHDPDFDWSDPAQLVDIFEKYLGDYGFVEVPLEQVRNGDVLLLTNRGLFNSHLGIYHDNTVIHQLGVSVAQPVSMFMTRINKVLRYEN